MFTKTKLRRGMIPKDKERGMLSIESWEKPCVTTTLKYFHCHLGQWLAGRKTTTMPMPTHSLSTTHLLACPLPRSWLFSFFTRTELKVPHSDCWGFAFPFSHKLLACGDVGFPLPHEFKGWWIVFSPLITQRVCLFSTIRIFLNVLLFPSLKLCL